MNANHANLNGFWTGLISAARRFTPRMALRNAVRAVQLNDRPASIMESMESRRMLAVGYNPFTDELGLNGNNLNNAFSVSLRTSTGAGGGVFFDVYENGALVRILDQAVEPVALITANLLAGDDAVAIGAGISAPLSANGGNDEDGIYGGDGNDTIFGGNGEDTIEGKAGVDVIHGDGDDDVIRGGNEGDSLYGDTGTDLIYGDQGADYIEGGADGYNVIFGGTERDTILAGTDDDFVYGEDHDDDINGETGHDYIDGGAGFDIIYGHDGFDILWGGSENDIVDGGDGNDEIHGDDGDDDLDGGNHDDEIYGDGGNDEINGGNDDDIAYGGDGSDVLLGFLGDDELHGGAHDDVLTGLYGVDTLYGDNGDDVLNGDGDDDFLYGGAHHDTLNGGGADDFMEGEGGDDELNGNEGEDTLRGGLGNDLLRGGENSDILRGHQGNDSLYGNHGTDELYGNEGLDGLYGGRDFADTLTGGADPDRFLDNYHISAGAKNWDDTLTDKANEDARVGFKDGDAVSNNSAGSWAAAAWTDAEVELADLGLGILHVTTGNKDLIQTRANGQIELIRQGADTDLADGISLNGWNFSNGTIHITDLGAGSELTETLLHEIGHNWDEDIDNAAWEALSGWTSGANSPGADYTQSVTGENWWFLTSAQFVSSFNAQRNPGDDFAETFANYFLNLAGLPWSGDGDIANIPDKLAFMDQFVIDHS